MKAISQFFRPVCFLGILALCWAIPVSSFGQPTPQDPGEDLKILSWNIHMLPYSVYHKTKKMRRAHLIAESLIRDHSYQIIVFQEAFHARARHRLRKMLRKKYPYEYGPANKKAISLKTNSGIWILSDRPLQHLAEIAYDTCQGDGCYARKGALLMQGEHNGNTFQVLGTHNNGGKPNPSQFRQLGREMIEPFTRKGVPLFICGDFNNKTTSPKNHWHLMLTNFGVRADPRQRDGRDSIHQAERPIQDVYATWPDFIFVRRNGCKNLEVTDLATISIGPVWQPAKKKIYMESVGYSDHYPVEIRVKWNPQNEVDTD